MLRRNFLASLAAFFSLPLTLLSRRKPDWREGGTRLMPGDYFDGHGELLRRVYYVPVGIMFMPEIDAQLIDQMTLPPEFRLGESVPWDFDQECPVADIEGIVTESFRQPTRLRPRIIQYAVLIGLLGCLGCSERTEVFPPQTITVVIKMVPEPSPCAGDKTVSYRPMVVPGPASSDYGAGFADCPNQLPSVMTKKVELVPTPAGE